MLETKFSKEEMNMLCQLLKRHGTDCATLADILGLANRASPNDAGATFKHIRLLKEFSVIGDRDILCHMCVSEVIDHHAEICEEYKERMKAEYFLPCPDEHYDYSKCEPAVWMVDSDKIYRLREKAEMNVPLVYRYNAGVRWLEETFPDIQSDIRHNLWMGFLCEKHIGSMKPYADRITGYVVHKDDDWKPCKTARSV